MTDIHITLNYVLFGVLIALLAWCLYAQQQHTEAFTNHRNQLATGPFRAEPTAPFSTSVFSSLPAKHDENTAYKFVTPFQSACTYTTAQCPKNQRFVCHLDGHNQRTCHWE